MTKNIPPVLIRIVAALACLALLIGATVSFSSSAHAAAGHVSRASASCYGTGCFNKDPYQSGCVDGSQRSISTAIVDNSGVTIGTVYNYYSKDCNANWAQGQLNTGNGGAALQISIYTAGETKLCYPDNCSSFYNGSYVAWTNMVNGTNVATACGTATSSRQYPRRSGACLNY